jgi:hypothetical protein
MGKFQRGMQEQPIQAGARQLLIKLAVAIAVVKGNRVARILRIRGSDGYDRSPGCSAPACMLIALFTLKRV